MATDLYQTVTDTILDQLQAGAAPWVKPWSGGSFSSNMPHNAASGRAYSGINVVLLWIAKDARGFASSRWLTFKQAIDAGGNVRKGEKGTQVVFVSAIEREEATAGGDTETRRIPFLKRYTVFNVEQCDNLPAKIVQAEAGEPRSSAERCDLAEEFVAATGAVVRHGEGRAYYRPSADFVMMPDFETFTSGDQYYSTLFHELGHWTGAKHRLDRDFSGRFGDRSYAAEELVAELTAAFLCAEFAFDGDLRHAGYIAHWIELLKVDNRAFFTAAAKAQKAADYMRGLALAAPVAVAA